MIAATQAVSRTASSSAALLKPLGRRLDRSLLMPKAMPYQDGAIRLVIMLSVPALASLPADIDTRLRDCV